MRRKVAMAAVILIGGSATAYAAGLRVNLSTCLPLGIYRVRSVGAIKSGSLVTACPSITPSVAQGRDRGWVGPGVCPTGLQPILKLVSAVAGDVVEVTKGGTIAVNGTILPNSAALNEDRQGRAVLRVPPGRYDVAPGTVWLMAPTWNAWDSRYFGPVKLSEIAGSASPVFLP